MPQVFQTTEIARPAYYDRDPVSIIPSASFTGAGHGDTVRATYTPPTPYATFIEAVYASVFRQAAAGVLGQAFCYLEYLPFYGGSIIILNAPLYNNTIQSFEIRQLQQFGYMAFGDTLKIHTGDGSTGGSVSYYMSAKGVEFQY